MKQEIAMQWADALESGKYKQGRLRLKTGDNEYCCLGVLCDLSGTGEWDYSNSYWHEDAGDPQQMISGAALTPIVAEWADVKDRFGAFAGSPPLSELNDQGKTFTEIAAIIRENWKEL